MMKESIGIGLGERYISTSADEVLVAYGLGSCLGICMIDPTHNVAGLLHAVLPVRNNGAEPFSAKFVDSGIEGLLDEMIKAGAHKHKMFVRMVGGANMLLSPGLSNTFDIGSRNIESARHTLQRLNLFVEKEDVGGHAGRTFRVYVGSGRTTVKIVGGTERDL